MLHGEILHPREHKKLIFTDASNAGWGTHSGQDSTGGLWSHPEKHLHINLLEMKVVFLALQFFKRTCQTMKSSLPQTTPQWWHTSTNREALDRQDSLMRRILTWCNQNSVTLRARHIQGSLDVIADGLSKRNQIQSTQWSLSPQIFKQIFQTLGESPSGLILNQPEQETPSLCLSNSRPLACRYPKHSMGKSSCVCFSSHRPAAQGGTKTPISNLQDNSHRPWLADKTMVLGPSGDVSGHTKTTTTHSHLAQTTTEQPISCHPSFPQSPCVDSRSSTLQERGFTAEVAERIAALQRLSTRAIYSSKWTVFQKCCTEEQVDFRNPSISDICNFFWYLFNVLN